MSSSSTHKVCQKIKEDLLTENSSSHDGQDRDERILDMLDRLNELEVDVGILTETKIGNVLSKLLNKKYNNSNVITSKARALVKKWKGIVEGAKNEVQDDPNKNGKSDDGDGDINNTDASKNGVEQSQNNKKVARCDICSKPSMADCRNGILQQCKDCNIYVHELCYCMVPTTSLNPNFTCHACNAVMTSVEVNCPSKIGGTDDIGKKRELVKIEERPMDCILCVQKSSCHAMHPIYDTWGKEGRQLVLKAKKAGEKRRLAWVHTLCAQILSIQKGYLYGVDKYGDWHGYTMENDGDDDIEDDGNGSEDDSDEEVGGQKYRLGTTIYKQFKYDASGKLRLFKGRVKKFNAKTKLYKIVYEDGDKEEMTEAQVKRCLQQPTNISSQKEHCESVATRNFCLNEDMTDEIKEARNLTCFVCRQDDKMSLRIPTQCNAGDEAEHAEFQKLHGHLSHACRKAMHVGCKFCFYSHFFFNVYSHSHSLVSLRCEMEGRHVRSCCGESATQDGLLLSGSVFG